MVVERLREGADRVGVIVRDLASTDREPIADLLEQSGAFSAEEIAVALEMVDAGLTGEYTALVAAVGASVRGYICVGPTPLTRSTWHMYWLCVHPIAQRIGVGQALERRASDLIRRAGGERVVVETSGRPDYQRSRRFYERAGYRVAGRIADYYKTGDDCVFYCRVL
jgi:ribosomal protein S18 acetylase RimI-like enzyme